MIVQYSTVNVQYIYDCILDNYVTTRETKF